MTDNNDKTERPEFVFGPVPSRRLGRSLGVDLIPFKYCTLDCIYCQLGRTTVRTLERFPFEHVAALGEQVRSKVASGPRPDHITLAGSGEPTLCSNLAEVIGAIRSVCDIPIAILTNGALLFEPAVRADCALADVVIPSLDAGSEEVFRYINRPCEALTLEKLVDGIVAFRKEFTGQLWLEVFLVAGINTVTAEIDRMRTTVERIKPDRVQLNTAVRPTAESYAHALKPAEMEQIRQQFGPDAEVIADFPHPTELPGFKAAREDVLAMLKRRPCTLADIAAGLGVPRAEAAKCIESLTQAELIVSERRGEQIYYAVR